jgi:hypothetical protein
MISVNIRHAYHNRSKDPRGGPCAYLAILPTRRTLSRLARYGLLVRRRPDGIEILSSSRHSEALRLSMDRLRKRVGGKLPAGTAEHLFGPPLLFTVEIVDPRFLNITEAPAGGEAASGPLILSNRRIEKPGPSAGAAAGAARLLLDGREPFRHRRSRFGKASRPAASKRLAGKAEIAAALLDPEGRPSDWWREPAAAFEEARAEQEALASSLHGLSFAWLELHVTAPTPRRGEPKGGVYPVNLEPEGPVSPEDESGGYLRPARYDVVFPARLARWRYVIADRHGSLDGTGLDVVDISGAKAGFSCEPHTPPPGAARAFALTSTGAFAIEERPGRRFKLVGKRLGSRRSEEVLCDPLPAPGPDLLTAHGTRADGAGIAEMHLFL